MITRYIFPFLFSLIFLASCNNSNRFKIDTSNPVKVTIERIDKQILAMDTSDILSGIKELSAAYPEFYAEYVAIWEMEPADIAEFSQFFRGFLTDTMLISVHKNVEKTFDNIADIERKISIGYTYINHYFPEIRLPEIYFFVGGFNRSLITESSFIGIGADWYLGRDYERYKMLTYDYLTYNLDPESIPVDVISTILVNVFRQASGKDRLIDNMLYQGKMLYLLSIFLPDETNENIIGYSKEHLKWCGQHEKAIWAAMIDQKDLFSSDYSLIRKYMNDAPFTSPISQESPGRLGAWVGWQIVKSYMERNTDVSLRDLVHESDYQKILEQSGYRP